MTEDGLDRTRKAGKTYERIIQHIRGEISSKKLRPGDRLQPEADLARSLGVSRPTVREALKVLWEAREVTDVPAAELAAVRRTEQDRFVIERTVEMDELKEGVAIVSDISFHRAIAEASKNRMLSLFAGSIHMTLRTLAERYVIPEDVLPEVKRISQQQHRLICEAISEQDRVLAASRMREHLQLSFAVYEQAMPRGHSGGDRRATTGRGRVL